MTIFRPLQQSEEDEALNVEFYLKLCFDVFLEVLRFGNRRRFAKLEPIGRRLHLTIENFFKEIPYLRLNIMLKTGFIFLSSFEQNL